MSESSETLSLPARRVVLVDNRDDRRQLMRHVIEGDDAKVILVGEADSRAAALDAVDRERADVVILDVQLPVTEGLATIAALRERYADLGIVVCSFDLDHTTAKQVLEHGADLCLVKPVRRQAVHEALIALPGRDRRRRQGDDRSGLPVAALPASTKVG